MMQDFGQAKVEFSLQLYVCSEFSMCQKDISQSWQVELGSASTTIHLAQMISIKQPAAFGEIRAMCIKQVKFLGPLEFHTFWTIVTDQLTNSFVS